MLTVLTLDQAEQWDATVRSFANHDVYWLSGYVKAFWIHGDGTPLLFHFDDGTTRGINVVMKRDIAKDPRFAGRLPEDRFFDFATPYGYGGWLVEGPAPASLFDEYRAWLERNGIVSEFVRFHPLAKNHESCTGFYDVLQLGGVVHMDLSSPAAIWDNMSGKNRNVIRKAVKNGVKIYNGRFPGIFAEFRKIYDATMDKDHAESYYYFGDAFYQSILDDLPWNSQVFFAEKDGQVISAAIMIGANGRLNYHLSGSLREYGHLAPGNLLLHSAALWGCANGFKTLYLGGGVGSGEDSLFKFKRAFYKGDLNRFHIGRKVFSQEKYDELVAMRPPADSGYFPKYRA
jgi:hypothetical protein